MGQKINPIGLRVGINKTWTSKWYVDPRDYAATLHEDLRIRKTLKSCPETVGADISEVEIIRKPQRITIVLTTSKPGIIIGTKGANVEKLGARLQKVSDKTVQIKIKEVSTPEADAQIIANNIARALEGRSPFRRVMKNAVSKAIAAGAKGIKVKLSGRLGGAEIARSEWMKEGRVPLHTLRSNIQYGTRRAETTFGTIGVKVWIFNGEVFDKSKTDDAGSLVQNDPKLNEVRS